MNFKNESSLLQLHYQKHRSSNSRCCRMGRRAMLHVEPIQPMQWDTSPRLQTLSQVPLWNMRAGYDWPPKKHRATTPCVVGALKRSSQQAFPKRVPHVGRVSFFSGYLAFAVSKGNQQVSLFLCFFWGRGPPRRKAKPTQANQVCPSSHEGDLSTNETPGCQGRPRSRQLHHLSARAKLWMFVFVVLFVCCRVPGSHPSPPINRNAANTPVFLLACACVCASLVFVFGGKGGRKPAPNDILQHSTITNKTIYTQTTTRHDRMR